MISQQMETTTTRFAHKRLFITLACLLGHLAIATNPLLCSAQEQEVRWKAHWEWIPGNPRPKNYYLYLRKIVDFPESLDQATAFVSADNRYKLFVNGKFLGRGPARSDPREQSYDVYDFSRELKLGKNVIAALVHHYGVSTGAYILGRGGFLFQCEAIIKSQSTVEILSNHSWKVARDTAWFQQAPRISSPLGFVEVYDANLEPHGWQTRDFDDSFWQSASIISSGGSRTPPGILPFRSDVPIKNSVPIRPWMKPVQRDIPMLQEEERAPVSVVDYRNLERNGISRGIMMSVDPLDIATAMSMAIPALLKVGKITNPENVLCRDGKFVIIQNNSEPEGNIGLRDNYFVVDFGTVVVGRVRMTLDGVKGGVVDLGYTERLTDGRVVPKMGSRYADRYLMRDGPQTWGPFGWKTFRYVLRRFAIARNP